MERGVSEEPGPSAREEAGHSPWQGLCHLDHVPRMLLGSPGLDVDCAVPQSLVEWAEYAPLAQPHPNQPYKPAHGRLDHVLLPTQSCPQEQPRASAESSYIRACS